MNITLAEIIGLQDSNTPESVFLEYKSKVDTKGEMATKFAAEICAFSNTRGGRMIIGVEDKNGSIEQITGVPSSDPDQTCLQYVGFLETQIEPKIRGLDVAHLRMPNGNYVFVIDVPRGFHGPYRVRNNSKFYLRRSSGKTPMEYAEIRDHFHQTRDIYDRIASLIRERIEKIASLETPRVIVPAPALTIHVVPFDAVDQVGGLQLNFLEMRDKNPDVMFAPPGRSGWNTEFNLFGCCTYSGSRDEDEATSYCQLFREGFVEGVAVYPSWYDGKRISPKVIHTTAIKSIQKYFSDLSRLGAGYPFAVSLTLTRIEDFDLAVRNSKISLGRYGGRPIIPPSGIRPGPIVIETADADIFDSTLPIFDQIWNAFGYEFCPHRSANSLGP